MVRGNILNNMDLEELITENKLILVPVLIILGFIIKKIQKIPDKFIPLILLFFGILFSVLTNSTFALQTVVQSVIQGILVTGAAVLGNQIPKQLKKEE
mgnify:CR=1 FL=1